MKTKKYIVASVLTIILVSLAAVNVFAASTYTPNGYYITVTIPETLRSKHTISKPNTTPSGTAHIWYSEFGVQKNKAIYGYAVPNGGYWSATGKIDYGRITRARTTADGTTIYEAKD